MFIGPLLCYKQYFRTDNLIDVLFKFFFFFFNLLVVEEIDGSGGGVE